MSKKLTIEIASDFVCPWCLVGHERLQKALEIAKAKNISIRWLPYELNSGMPESGMDRREYLSAKFGSEEKLNEIEANMKAIGEEDGIDFRHDLIKKSPNTLKAHRLNWLAQKENKAEVAHAILLAYFTQGKDIGDTETLISIAAEAGMNTEKVRKFLQSDEGTNEIRALQKELSNRGVRMVPTFKIGEKEITGANPPAVLVEAINTALAA